MKKVLILMFILVGFSFVLLPNKDIVTKVKVDKPQRQLTHKLPVEEKKIVEQKVTSSLSAIKRELPTSLEKKKLIDKVLGTTEYSSIEKELKQQLSQSLDKSNKKHQKILEYINDFDIQAELEAEFAKLHADDLRNIIEVENHVVVKKLEQEDQMLNKEDKKKFIEKVKKGETFENSPKKQSLIDDVANESNLYQNVNMLASSVSEAAYYESYKKRNPKYNEAELKAKSKQFAKDQLKKQTKIIKASLNRVYGKLSHDELTKYLHHLQKHNAKRATKLSMEATSNVLKRFVGGYFQRM